MDEQMKRQELSTKFHNSIKVTDSSSSCYSSPFESASLLSYLIEIGYMHDTS